MSFSVLDGLASRLAPFLAQSGSFVSSGHGMPHGHHEPLEIAIAAILGALGGFVGGLLLSKLARFAAFSFGHDLATGRWAIYGTIAGAIAGAVWETFSE
jgi:H+/Cl- antiporter ClcA